MESLDEALTEIVDAILDPSTVSPEDLTASIETYVEAKVQQALQSLGGKLLSEHGPMSVTPNSVLASVGGYLTGMEQT